MITKVMTANRLRDGAVAYLDDAGVWRDSIQDARIAGTETEEAALVAIGARDVAERIVIGPYLIEVAVAGGAVQPLHYREQIRATGPSVRPDLGKQADHRTEPRRLAHV